MILLLLREVKIVETKNDSVVIVKTNISSDFQYKLRVISETEFRRLKKEIKELYNDVKLFKYSFFKILADVGFILVPIVISFKQYIWATLVIVGAIGLEILSFTDYKLIKKDTKALKTTINFLDGISTDDGGEND